MEPTNSNSLVQEPQGILKSQKALSKLLEEVEKPGLPLPRDGTPGAGREPGQCPPSRPSPTAGEGAGARPAEDVSSAWARASRGAAGGGA